MSYKTGCVDLIILRKITPPSGISDGGFLTIFSIDDSIKIFLFLNFSIYLLYTCNFYLQFARNWLVGCVLYSLMLRNLYFKNGLKRCIWETSSAKYLWHLKRGLVTKNKLMEYESPMTGHSNDMTKVKVIHGRANL